jgi:hypothetical protein
MTCFLRHIVQMLPVGSILLRKKAEDKINYGAKRAKLSWLADPSFRFESSSTVPEPCPRLRTEGTCGPSGLEVIIT